jgi:hypothetical protein
MTKSKKGETKWQMEKSWEDKKTRSLEYQRIKVQAR